MSTDANREAIRRAFAAWRDEGAPITGVFAPEMTWRIEGRSVVAGDYADRQDFAFSRAYGSLQAGGYSNPTAVPTGPRNPSQPKSSSAVPTVPAVRPGAW